MVQTLFYHPSPRQDYLATQWEETVASLRTKNGGKMPGLIRILWSSGLLLKWKLAFIPLFLTYNVFNVALPYLIREMLYFLADTEGDEYTVSHGLIITVLLTMSGILSVVLRSVYWMNVMRTGNLVRILIMDRIYDKSLKVSQAAQSTITVGKTVNLLAVDGQRLYFFTTFAHFLVQSPFTIFLCLGLMVEIVGVSAVAGVLVCTLNVPLQLYVGSALGQLREKSMKASDERVKLTNEILQGIRFVKLSASEDPLLKQLSEYRNEELKHQRRFLTINGINRAIVFSLPILALTAVAVTYQTLGNVLTVDKAMTVFAFLTILRHPIALFPLALGSLSEARTSLKRLNAFFALKEKNEDWRESLPADSALLLKMEKGTFFWQEHENEKKEEIKPTLKGLHLDVRRGEKTAVVGPVGAGKTSLLCALLGEMAAHQTTKIYTVDDLRVSYMSQTAFIRNATVKDNILFGWAYDADRYARCVDAAALSPDLEVLANGDSTEIGEVGMRVCVCVCVSIVIV
jgi:ATP-binding cassette subfamily C (CFTR/MRP) protein 1